MADYDGLEKYSLALHGDRWEREWWGLAKDDFPAYEVFWRRYVVPLTNRVCGPTVPEPQWIRIRFDISSTLEEMTMFHYSVFYFLARAVDRTTKQPIFPEDVFALLCASGENALAFFREIGKILRDFGRKPPEFPSQMNQLGPFEEVEKYRNVLLHNPVLGHALERGSAMLPKPEMLDKVKCSWRAVAALNPSDFVDSHQLYARLISEIGEFLEVKWRQIISALDALRDTEKFKKKWRLEKLLPVSPPPEPNASVHNPVTVSSALVASSASAHMPIPTVLFQNQKPAPKR